MYSDISFVSFVFPCWLLMLNIFSCVYFHLCILFGITPLYSFRPFYISSSLPPSTFLLNFASSLHILDASPFSNVWFANIPFPHLACLFSHLPGPFIEQKFLSLIKFNLSSFFKMDHVFGIKSKNAA